MREPFKVGDRVWFDEMKPHRDECVRLRGTVTDVFATRNTATVQVDSFDSITVTSVPLSALHRLVKRKAREFWLEVELKTGKVTMASRIPFDVDGTSHEVVKVREVLPKRGKP